MSWDTIKEKCPTVFGLDDWLRSFLTAEIIEENALDKTCIDFNWINWYEIVNKEPISNFEYLGVAYCIYKTTQRHKYCKCEWTKYLVGNKIMNEDDNLGRLYGTWFDETNGTQTLSESQK